MIDHTTPHTHVDTQTPLTTARRICWLILVLCVVVAVGGLVWLGVLYVVSLAQLPDMYTCLSGKIAEAQDISVIKSACLKLAQLDESDLTSRRNWIVLAPTLALFLAVGVAVLAALQLRAIRKIERFISQARNTHAG